MWRIKLSPESCPTKLALRWLLTACLVWMCLTPSITAAAPPLHAEIDRLISQHLEGPVAKPAADHEFLRRVYLDLTGVIPSTSEARRFLADSNDDKRANLIARLLASPEYARHMQQRLTVMLLERRAGQTISDPKWNEFVRASFAANRPWDAFVRELVAADGLDEVTQPAIRFFVDGGRADQHQATRDVARIFLGMDIQCAQCHDHPSIPDFHQADYFGLYAYLRQSKLQKTKSSQKPVLVETVSTGKVEFQSVFQPDEKRATGPRLPGLEEIAVPTFAKGEEFSKPAEDGLPGLPKFRPRHLLSKDLTTKANSRFVLNSVNRFWFLMMGRGLVHPLDMMHSANPASHPELLSLLGDRFVANKFDVKYLLREIALSQAYQRSSLLPASLTKQDVDPKRYRVGLPRPLSAEQLALATLQATGNLSAVLDAPIPEKSEFTYKDYINGRIPLPENLPDVLTLFAATFGNPPGEAEVEFQPSVQGSLFLLNEKLIGSWLKPRDGNLTNRLAKINDPAALCEELYLSVLSRRPTDQELVIVRSYLSGSAERSEAIGQLAWSLISSAEFRLNH